MVEVALFGWPILSLGFFLFLRPRRAVLASVLLGWMFLPVATYKFGAGIPEYSKMAATSLGALLGVLIFDARRLISFRPNWADLPMAIWCVCPFASSISNDLGVHDGLSSMYYKIVFWGIPYLLGRIYCSNLLGMNELAWAIFLGGVLYAPFCLLEIRLSPQLHSWVYGFHQHSFEQAIRFGGFRPTVFMHHGIMVSTWMAMATLSGIWLWKSKLVRRIGNVPVPWILAGMAVTTVLCKSMGALVLLLGGLVLLWASRSFPSRVLVVSLALLAPIYLGFRVSQGWSGNELADAAKVLSKERSASLKFRIINEELLVDKALSRPVFGWGLWGRARIHDASGRDLTVTDSLWIIELGNEGLVGLLGMLAVFLMPLYGLHQVVPNPAAWRHRLVAPAYLLVVVTLLFLIDCMFNDMNNPAYLIAVGGLSSLRLGIIKRRAPKAAPIEGVPWAPSS